MNKARTLLNATVASKTIEDIDALIDIDPTHREETIQAAIESAVKHDRVDVIKHYFDAAAPYAEQELTHIMIKACEYSALQVMAFCIEDVELTLTNTGACLDILFGVNNGACIDLFLSHHHEAISSDNRLLDFHVKGSIAEIAHLLIPHIEHQIQHQGIIKAIVTSPNVIDISYSELSRVLGSDNAKKALFGSLLTLYLDMDVNRNPEGPYQLWEQ
mgnify:CR=1 FL=1